MKVWVDFCLTRQFLCMVIEKGLAESKIVGTPFIAQSKGDVLY